MLLDILKTIINYFNLNNTRFTLNFIKTCPLDEIIVIILIWPPEGISGERNPFMDGAKPVSRLR